MKHMNILRYVILLTLALCGVHGLRAQLAISANGALVPNAKAMLELSDTRGFLIPRVTNAQRPPGATAANSLLIYQTDSVGTEPVGFYYWDATLAIANKWVHVGWGNSWKLGGNAGTNPATDFIGSTNAAPLRISTNGTQRINIAPTGQVQISTLLPATERMEVNGAVRITGASAAVPTEGAIRFNAATGAHEGYAANPLAGANEITYPAGWYQLENVFKTRVKQRYISAPAASCQYPTPAVVPSGGNPGSWPTIDGPNANFGSAATLETPYSLFWEDGRHQYLYTAADLQALNICPNTPIKGIAFQTTAAGSGLGMRNIRVKMKSTTTASITDFDNAGLVTYGTYGNYAGGAVPDLVTVNGWNAHVFNTNLPGYNWPGPGINMLVEYCFDNQDWTTNTPVQFENTAFNSLAGLYCDACGHPTLGASTCYYTGPCNGFGTGSTPPGGVSQITPGIICTGWGWGGTSGGGCAWSSTSSLTTCDGTFQYQGAWTIAARRPILKIDAQTNGVFTTFPNASYLLAQDGVMVGSYAAWANSALYAPPNYMFKGPGTLSARSSVWGGSVLLSDHVFDLYYDGKTRPEDAKQAAGYQHYNVAQMADYVARERHLPTIDGRASWKAEGGLFSADKLTNQLWVTVEQQSLYIKELNERMDALQQFLVEKRLKELRKK